MMSNSDCTLGLNPSTWMQDSIHSLGGRKLKELCIPGSHDAGMSVLNGKTSFSTEHNTVTQSISVGEQLNCGIRFFDIRPVIGSPERFMTGHYSYVDITSGHQGGNGQSIRSVVEQINTFTTNKKELIVLELSGTLNTNVGYGKYRDFTPAEWDELFDLLSGINHLYILRDDNKYLTSKSLSHYIGSTSAVIIVVNKSDVNLSHANRNGVKFFNSTNFAIFNEYANSDSLPAMFADQINKMRSTLSKNRSNLFLLSWTLTQQGTGTLSGPSIRQLADMANAELPDAVRNCVSSDYFPNIIMIDNVRGSMCADLCMEINQAILNPGYAPFLSKFSQPRDFDTGICSDVSVSEDGVVIEVHESEHTNTLWHHTGTIGNNEINWSGSMKYDSGKTPCIAHCRGGLVEVHKSEGTSRMWTHSGKVNPGPSLEWWGSVQLSNGFVPKIGMNADGYFITVSTSTRSGCYDLYACVGRVQNGNATRGAEQSLQGDNGRNPAVAINKGRQAIEVHGGGDGSGRVFYHVGYLSDSLSLTWGPSRHYQMGQFPQVALTDDGRVFLTFSRDGWIFCGVATLPVNSPVGSATLTWIHEPIRYCRGDRSSVSLSGDGRKGTLTIENNKKLKYATFSL